MATYNEVLQIITNNLAPGSNITAQEHKVVEEAILNFANSQWLTGDIKEIDCTDAYISNNFDGNGIGTNERLGWAICNGYNGLTKNRTGRVSVGWGTTATDDNGTSIAQPNMYANGVPVTFGEKTHILTTGEMPEHGHKYPTHGNDGGGWAGNIYSHSSNVPPLYTDGPPAALNVQLTDRPGSTNTSKPNKEFSTRPIGGGSAHNNAQPSIVTLFIQKL